MDVKIGTEAAQFPDKEYINGIFVAVLSIQHMHRMYLQSMYNLFAEYSTSHRINKLKLSNYLLDTWMLFWSAKKADTAISAKVAKSVNLYRKHPCRQKVNWRFIFIIFSSVSGSDCDTESCSTYRSVSEPTSSGRSATGGNFSPIYEEIVDTASCRRGCSPIQAGRGTPRSRGPPDVAERGVGDGDLVGSGGGGGMAAATASRLTASPRAVSTSAAAGRSYQRTLPVAGAAASPPPPSSTSVYYYSDTLRRGSGRSAASPSLLPDTDSGISSSGISSSASRSSGHNTSSESTPLPRLSADTAFGGGHNVRGSLRSRRLPFPLPLSAAAGPVVSSDEDVSGFYGGEGAGVSPRGGSGRRLGGLAPRPQPRSSAKPVDTQVIDRNASSRKPPANLWEIEIPVYSTLVPPCLSFILLTYYLIFVNFNKFYSWELK